MLSPPVIDPWRLGEYTFCARQSNSNYRSKIHPRTFDADLP